MCCYYFKYFSAFEPSYYFLFFYQIIYDEVEKSLFEKKIEKKEGKAYTKQGASKRPNVEV